MLLELISDLILVEDDGIVMEHISSAEIRSEMNAQATHKAGQLSGDFPLFADGQELKRCAKMVSGRITSTLAVRVCMRDKSEKRAVVSPVVGYST